MDPRLLYTDFVMDGVEVSLQPTLETEVAFVDDRGYTYCTLMAFGSDDPAIARDPLSTNRRLPDTADLELFGTIIVAGPTPDQIFVLIPDSVGPTGDATSADIQHVVGLSLGPAENLNSTLPAEGLHLALCETSVLPTLNPRNHDYWSELNPILQKWQNVNDASCPHCNRTIRVNMSRHLQSAHMEFQCFWRCPVASCPLWFLSELNGKDHLERIHSFKEGQKYSFYECLRIFGLEWFGHRSFFDRREVTGQSLWMDLALARRTGHPLCNNYSITNSPAMAPLRKLFRAAVRHLTSAYETIQNAQAEVAQEPSICSQMRLDIVQELQDDPVSAYVDQGFEIPEVESLSPLILPSATPPPVMDTPVRPVTRNKRVTDIPSIWTVRPTTVLFTSRSGCSFLLILSEFRTSDLRRTTTIRPVVVAQHGNCTILASCCTRGTAGGGS